MARVAPPRRALGWGSGGGAICAYGDSLRFADEVLLSRGCRMHGGTVITSMCQYAVLRYVPPGRTEAAPYAGSRLAGRSRDPPTTRPSPRRRDLTRPDAETTVTCTGVIREPLPRNYHGSFETTYETPIRLIGRPFSRLA